MDFWHTLAYLPPGMRRRVERERLELWRDTLQDRGLSLDQATRWARRIAARNHRLERRGRAPSIPAQLRYVRRTLGRDVPERPFAKRMDAVILRATLRPLPGALRALRALRRSGLRLALISNLVYETPPTARRLLHRLGFAPYFPIRVYSADHPFSKPDPRIYRVALRRLRVPAAAALHVGDLDLDVLGARRAGLEALRITWNEDSGGRRRRRAPRDVADWDGVATRILELQGRGGDKA